MGIIFDPQINSVRALGIALSLKSFSNASESARIKY